MRKLVIHAPSSKNQKTPFHIIRTAYVGPKYAIYRNLVNMLTDNANNVLNNTGVILLDNRSKLRAEGLLVKLDLQTIADNGIRRYDVHFKDIRMVDYKYIRVNRCGIAVIEEAPE